jgi:hypothetical protein
VEERKKAMQLIMQGAKLLGWTIYHDADVTVEDCQGLVMGTAGWMESAADEPPTDLN